MSTATYYNWLDFVYFLDPEIYNQSTMCNSNKTMKAGLHFLWNCSDVNYYSIEWGLYCDKGYLKDIIVEMFFMGSAMGTVISWWVKTDSDAHRSYFTTIK